MWRVTLAGVVAHRLRYTLTALAVLLGVAFIAGTFVLNDTHSATVGHFRVGDKVTVLSQQHPATYTITGIVTWGRSDSVLGATVTAFTPARAARVLGQPGKVSQIDIQAAPRVPQPLLMSRLRAAVRGTPDVQVVSGQAV